MRLVQDPLVDELLRENATLKCQLADMESRAIFVEGRLKALREAYDDMVARYAPPDPPRTRLIWWVA